MLIIKNVLLYSLHLIIVIDVEIKDQFFKLVTIYNIIIKNMILHLKKNKINPQKEFLIISFDCLILTLFLNIFELK